MPDRMHSPAHSDSPVEGDGHYAAMPALRWVHRLFGLLALTVFPLIWAGGLVTTTKAGMAVPDWPGTFGYNMFLYPWSTWFFGPWDLFIEHGHRLLGSLAGIWCLVLVAVCWLCRVPGYVRTAATAALFLVVLQGTLGGVRVLQVDREVARFHGCLGPAFFAFVVGCLAMTSRWWQRAGERRFWLGRHGDDGLDGRSLASATSGPQGNSPAPSVTLTAVVERLLARLRTQRYATLILLGLAYMQLVLGASMRHVPDDAEPTYFRVLTWFHLSGAAATSLAALTVAFSRRLPVQGVTKAKWGLLFLVGLQVSLGCGTWVVKYGFPAWFGNYPWAANHLVVNDDFYQVQIVTGHVAVGSLILATAVFLAVRLWRAEWALARTAGYQNSTENSPSVATLRPGEARPAKSRSETMDETGPGAEDVEPWAVVSR